MKVYAVSVSEDDYGGGWAAVAANTIAEALRLAEEYDKTAFKYYDDGRPRIRLLPLEYTLTEPKVIFCEYYIE